MLKLFGGSKVARIACPSDKDTIEMPVLVIVGEVYLVFLLHLQVNCIDQDTLLHVLFRFFGVNVELQNHFRDLLMAVGYELGDRLLLLTVLILELGEAVVEQLKRDKVIVCDLRYLLKRLVRHLASFLCEVSILNLQEDLQNIFVVFSIEALLHNQVWDIEEYEKILIDYALLLHRGHELSQNLEAIRELHAFVLRQSLQVIQFQNLVGTFRKLAQEIVNDLAVFGLSYFVVAEGIVLVNTLQNLISIHVEHCFAVLQSLSKSFSLLESPLLLILALTFPTLPRVKL